MMLAFILAVDLTYQDINVVSFGEFLAMRIKVQNFVLFAGYMWLWHGMFSLFHLYDANRTTDRKSVV